MLVPLAVFGVLVQRRVRSWWLLLPLAAATWVLMHESEHFEHRFRPLSAGFAVPVFALFSAGVAIGGLNGLGASLTHPVAVGIMAGLVAGKTVGITAATWVARFTRGNSTKAWGGPTSSGWPRSAVWGSRKWDNQIPLAFVPGPEEYFCFADRQEFHGAGTSVWTRVS